MGKLYLATANKTLGSSGRYVYDRMGGHRIIAVTRLRLDHEATMRLAEGASLLSLFTEVQCIIGDRASPASVLSGTFALYKTGAPELQDVIIFVPKDDEPRPALKDIITKGVGLLNGAR